MLHCSECETHFPRGTLVCSHDGHAFSEGVAVTELVHAFSRGKAPRPFVTLLIEHIDGMDLVFRSPKIVIYRDRFGEEPIRLGLRAPPVFPEVDFHQFFDRRVATRADVRPPIANHHAGLVLKDHRPHLRALSLGARIFYRQAGAAGTSEIHPDKDHRLSNGELLFLGDPNARHIRLRVLLSAV